MSFFRLKYLNTCFSVNLNNCLSKSEQNKAVFFEFLKLWVHICVVLLERIFFFNHLIINLIKF